MYPEDDSKISPHAAELSASPVESSSAENDIRTPPKGRFAYIKSPRFWLVLLIGQILSLCITSTNTFSGLLGMEGTSIPAFQSFFNYVLLNLVYTSYTLYKYGFKGWCKMVSKEWWRYIIMAFLDVEGNYFVVLAYRYTTILSAQLINFWAIVVVVIISFFFLHVRYKWTQVLGILICCGGLGLLLANDAKNGSVVGGVLPTEVKGDLFMLLGATFYGFSNVFEEFLVSKKPMYEVIGQIGFWGMLINGAQAGIFDRSSFRTANWNSKVGGYMTGFTLTMFIFYTVVPILLRMASAAFFNISLLTANFWGVCIGVQVFGYTIGKWYPIAFVMIILGLVIYFVMNGTLGESEKPWLGENQEEGVAGVGTAKRALGKGRGDEA
ncbi:uncharacterized protein LAJ45_08196 [Morchella importuna]|uniref:DUF914-domain-containing protein n=1 Tax=Morchella conica CCBAS932 TaxID=1392247 RepID=A0A3N4KIM5_9PEZI|nr:uncharacterized protein LAJ45_08196 [Morchella importuna]KAH8147731.1 hypothetical protein LAJ45_08196 [Morchella importuna]RPB10406.1 DUF914-domain-containing protein [Morchella conica CCBAS932]